MIKAYIETEYNDYDISAYGFVISGEVHNFHYILENVDATEYPNPEELEDLEEYCKEELINSVYNPELKFD